jgi:hypothetical protein
MTLTIAKAPLVTQADDALDVFENIQGETPDIDEETNQRLVKKIDRNIMPVGLPILGPAT